MLQTILSGFVKAYPVGKEKLIKKVKEISGELKENFKFVKKIVVFGSIARGEQRGLSDVDLIVVVDKINKGNFWEIYGEVYNFLALKIDAGIDLVIMNKEDFETEKGKYGKMIILWFVFRGSWNVRNKCQIFKKD